MWLFCDSLGTVEEASVVYAVVAPLLGRQTFWGTACFLLGDAQSRAGVHLASFALLTQHSVAMAPELAGLTWSLTFCFLSVVLCWGLNTGLCACWSHSTLVSSLAVWFWLIFQASFLHKPCVGYLLVSFFLFFIFLFLYPSL